MAQTLPVLISFIICLYNCKIFTNYHPDIIAAVSPLVSSQMIKLSMFFILLDVKLVPRKFRRIHFIPQGIYESVIGIFLTESALFCLWFPLEKCILSSIPRYLRCIYVRAARNGMIRQAIEFLCNNNVLMVISYALSLLILCCVMHATRVVDFRLIRECGIKIFFEDVAWRAKRGVMKIINSLKIWKKRSNVRYRKCN